MIASMLFACKDSGRKEKDKEENKKDSSTAVAPVSYDFTHPDHQWIVPDSLKEISGIAKVDKNTILGIEDLHANLYFLDLSNSNANITATYSFAETAKDKFDIEDVALVKDTAYALWSHGALFKVWDWKKKLQVTEMKTELKKENNTEGLAYDPVSGDLLIACKDESGMEDEKKSTRAIYQFDTKTKTLKTDPFLLIHKKDIQNFIGEKVEFYPSAIGVHPVTHDIYIISTRGDKCIAQFTHDGNLKAFSYLDKELLAQPEGICFDPDGNMYISTQGRHGGPPMIYQFNEKKK
jgi:hypothetical protein